MYEFTIEYYHKLTLLNVDETRIGVIYANNTREAITKIHDVDVEFKHTKSIAFREIREDCEIK